MRRLSTVQRIAIRCVGECGHRGRTTARTWNGLVRNGIVKEEGGVDKLTPYGQRCYEAIMASGDGPEELKELFRF